MKLTCAARTRSFAGAYSESGCRGRSSSVADSGERSAELPLWLSSYISSRTAAPRLRLDLDMRHHPRVSTAIRSQPSARNSPECNRLVAGNHSRHAYAPFGSVSSSALSASASAISKPGLPGLSLEKQQQRAGPPSYIR